MQLRRITSGSSWIPQIDGLRFAAIAAVVLTHAFSEVARTTTLFQFGLNWWVNVLFLGTRGVPLFFAISGYILSRPFMREHLHTGHKVELGHYFMRRLTRLEPPYLLSLVIYVVAQHFMLHTSFQILLPSAGASAVYLHNQIFPHQSAVNFVIWTLEIEVQFYILAPLLGQVFRIQNTTLRRTVIVLMIGVGMLLSLHQSQRYSTSLLGFLQYFLIGFLLVDLLEFPRRASRLSWWWDIVSLVVWPIIFLVGPDVMAPQWLVAAIPLVFLAAFRGKASSWFFRQPWVALTGGMCYSIYLLHMLLMEGAYRAVKFVHVGGGSATVLVQIALLCVPVMVGSTVYFVLVERPCMDPKWPQKLWARWRGRGLTAELQPPTA